jgi:hypothetical protein
MMLNQWRSQMPIYSVTRSYTVAECHTVKAKDQMEAIQMVKDTNVETPSKEYDGDYERDKDGSILYTVEYESE